MADPSVTLITGANSGIGLDAAQRLALAGGTVVLLCRNVQRGIPALDAVRAESGNRDVHLVTADLASFAEVRAAAAVISERWARVTALVNNAGLASLERKVTKDGFELTMQVNHLSPFLLTHLLLGPLRRGRARVVNVSSEAHRRARLEPGGLEASLRGHTGYRGVQAYCDSKLANILFTAELARRERSHGITANALHPGALSTAIWDRHGGWKHGVAQLLKLFMGKPSVGGAAVERLVGDPALEGVTGRYFHRQEPREPRRRAANVELALELWRESARAVGVDSGE